MAQLQPVRVYSKKMCPFCVQAKNLLKNLNIQFEEIDVEASEGVYEKLKLQTGLRTVPQIFIGDKLVGGFTDLDALHKAGNLVPQVLG